MKTHQVIHKRFLLLTQQESLVDSELLLPNADFDRFCRTVFVNWTPGFPSLRCTNLGFNILKKVYQVWAVPLDGDTNTVLNSGTLLLKLHQNLRTPYYLNKNNFYVFSSETALELEMANRDLSVWCRMF